MKKITILLFLFIISNNYSQVVPIPDLEFKGILLSANGPLNNIAKDLAGNPATIDTNGDNEIQVSEALQISYISTVGLGNNIFSFQGIEYFTNLVEFQCIQSQITTIDLSSNVNLTKLDLRSNGLTAINLANNNNLNYLDLSYTQISSLNISNLTQLRYLYFYNLPISTFDFSFFPFLQEVYCTGTTIAELDFSNNPIFNSLICGSPSLTYLNIKNGFTNASQGIQVSNSPNYKYLCCDENEQSNFINSYAVLFPNCNIGNYCSFSPGGTFYTITGETKFDADENGCDINDIILPNLKFDINSSNSNGSFYANATGNYSVPLQEGNYFVYPRLENPTYYNISPAFFSVQFPFETSPYNQNFCITPNGVHNDLEVSITRLKAPIPGTDVPYRIIFKNKGNQIQSGTITLNFDDAIMDFVSSNPAETSIITNQLTWNYTNLKPFETRTITFIMNLNSPMETPPVNTGDRIEFSGSIQPTNNAISDDFPYDNNINVSFGVVNSADPNDITCLEGNIVGTDKIGKYVHYMIRFENIGTAEAMNVVIKNLIDTNKFDVTTLIPLYSNYDFITKQKNNQFEFIFENINLPFDDENNDGYLVYKIKLKNNLVVGDTFTNQANIYFDFNFPILTNTESTVIQQTLNSDNFSIGNKISIYPNPSTNVVNIEGNTSSNYNIEVYDLIGKQIGSYKNEKSIDVSNFISGIYLIKIIDLENNIESTHKIIKN